MSIYYMNLVSRIYRSRPKERFLIPRPLPSADQLERDTPRVAAFGNSDQWEILSRFCGDVRCPSSGAKACDLVYRVPGGAHRALATPFRTGTERP